MIPYAKFLGVELSLQEGTIISHLPFKEGNIGNPILAALHGGAVAGFLENAALLDLMWQTP